MVPSAVILRRCVPAGVALIVTGLYALLSVVRFQRFAVVSWDNAIFEQAVKSYAAGHMPIVDVKAPGFNVLGDHFSPVIAVLAPIYRVFPSAYTILLAQCVLIGISVWVVSRLAIDVLPLGWGVVIGVCYGLSFGLQTAVAADFHEISFAVPLLALAGAAYLRGDMNKVIAWSLPLLVVKENMGVTVAAIGVVLWWAGHRVRGYVMVAVGVVATILVVWVIVPSFNPSSQYDYLGKLDGGGAQALLEQPALKLSTLAATFAVTGFLALRSPWVILVIPTFAWRFAGDDAAYWGMEYHYSAVLMPIVFVAMIDAMSRTEVSKWMRQWIRVAPAVALGVVVAFAAGSPLWDLTKPGSWQPNTRERAAEETISQLPDGASVQTDIGLMTHLVSDHTVYWIGSNHTVRPDYVLLEPGRFGSPDDVAEYATSTFGGSWKRVSANGPFRLYVSR